MGAGRSAAAARTRSGCRLAQDNAFGDRAAVASAHLGTPATDVDERNGRKPFRPLSGRRIVETAGSSRDRKAGPHLSALARQQSSRGDANLVPNRLAG
jgi:hypothetical protein